MATLGEWRKRLDRGELDHIFDQLLLFGAEHKPDGQARERFRQLLDNSALAFSGLEKTSGQDLLFFSAPGRTEIIGNHTDHQGGKVIAAAVNLDVWGMAGLSSEPVIHFHSAGWPSISLPLGDWEAKEEERGTSLAILRGLGAAFVNLGYMAKGLNIYCQSNVLQGSGLSSSAAIELVLAKIFNEFWADGRETDVSLAKLGQFAENQFFGKPSGLMDQLASALGSAVYVDFAPDAGLPVNVLSIDLDREGYALCIVDSGADHADLTPAYAAIPREMGQVAGFFGKELLSDLKQDEFYREIRELRERFGDRAVLRSIHFFEEQVRVESAANAIKAGNFSDFLSEIRSSGRSSWEYLQNVVVAGEKVHQELALALALADKVLDGKGACRVHGGGFAGTIQAFVPKSDLENFKLQIENVFGRGSCHILKIREPGAFSLDLTSKLDPR